MNINGNSWHCRVYKWWYYNKYGQQTEAAWDENYRLTYVPVTKENSNLCPYMRAVLFWAPLRAIFFPWIKLGAVPFNALTIPVILYAIPKLLGYLSYDVKYRIFRLYAVLAICLVVVALIFGLAWTAAKLFKTPVAKKIEGGLIARIDSALEKIVDSDFWPLLKEFFRSAHDRICPEVNWKENQ
jgi:hypothetical protein